jgi:hypothetical protein
VSSEAIVGVERGLEGCSPFALVPVRVGVGPELEQHADKALCLAVSLRPVGTRLPHRDPSPPAALGPAPLEAGAVVAEDALDPDPLASVEALAGSQGRRAPSRRSRRHRGGRSRAGWRRRSRRTGRGSRPCPSPGAVAGDAMAGGNDPAELLHVDVDQLAGSLALVADDRAAIRGGRSREQPWRLRIACTVEAASPSAQPRGCRPRRSSARARRTACSTVAGVRLGERRGREEWSARPSPRRHLPTHFEAVCREQPTTSAAAVIVVPAPTSATRRSRWRWLRAALA